LTIPDAIQLGALGILGVIVISGMSLFKWAVQKWLPSYVSALKECSQDICGALNNLSEKTVDLKREIYNHDENTERFDSDVKSIIGEIREVKITVESQVCTLERLVGLNETLVQDVLKRQTEVFERILGHIETNGSDDATMG